ncbi:MAG: hypothetical protein KY395_07025 [Actinobacteria bacterium]|nr:hypothetical protein [Actinomycetota bacterium]
MIDSLESRQDRRSTDWLSSGVVSGFIATGVMMLLIALGYGMVAWLGSADPQAPTLQRWMWALANNTVTERTQSSFPLAGGLHFVSGIGWALIYAAVVEPRLRGPGWRRGLLFSLLPWVFSLVVFLPAVGGGFLGLGLGAGPLPILGNLALHLAYGLVLGQVHSPWGQRLLVEEGDVGHGSELLMLARQQRAMAVGLVAGLVLGGLVGWAGSVGMDLWSSPAVAALLGAIAGSIIGTFIASFLGLPGDGPGPRA